MLVIIVPLFEIIVYPLFWKCLSRLGIVKKFILGMVLQFFFQVSLLVLEVIGHQTTLRDDSNRTVTCLLKSTTKDVELDRTLVFDFKWLAIPQMLQGVSWYFLATTTIEFLCAQSPYSMKGLISGCVYGIFGISIIF